jgi:hypothetical protein
MASISNLYVDQGSDFSFTIDLTNSDGSVMDLSGYTGAASVKKAYSSSSAAATFNVTVNDSTGQLTLELTDTQTAGLEYGRYVYDCVITASGGDKTRVVEGQVVVTPGVTL